MELSGNAKRALEVVERNLSILYGADYFTNEEWVKIDSLLHKGKYVLSDGPPKNILEEPLMTFEEIKDDQNDVVEIPPEDSFCQTKSDSIVISEETVSSHPSEHGDSIPSPESSSETPIDTSDEDVLPQPQPTADPAACEPETSNTTVQVTSQPVEAEPRPATNNLLPSGCTQEQLDEIRAFNASLTKAGHKTRPKYEPIVEDSPSEWIEDYNEPSRGDQSYPSPPPTEREARINTWADGVAKLPSSPNIESPTPSRLTPKAPAVEILAEQFIKAHGRQPKSLNDFYQPNNPNHHPKRPGSGASMKTSKTSSSIRTAAQSAIGQLMDGNAPPSNSGIVTGKVYVAQTSAPQKGIRIEVRAGDHIKVLKFVSGMMYIGENLRSRERGQFPESIFRRDPLASRQSVIAERTLPSFQRGLDQVENVNAAEWDDVSSIKRPDTAAPTSRPYLAGGLAASRFSTTADRAPARQSIHAPQGNIASDMAGQIGKIINDKFEEILKSRGVAPAPAPHTSSRPEPKGVQSVVPKTETCWYWSVKNDCRFTADECRDLHAFIPNRTGEPANLRQSKPTWGALADSLPSPSSIAPSNVGVIGDGLKARSKTCYYWAISKSCTNSASTCKYLHEYSPLGIAPKPGSKPPPTWRREWRALQEQEQKDELEQPQESELVLEEVDQSEVDGWGQPVQKPSESTWGGGVWGDDKYKPPQVKALEDLVAQQAVGW